MEYPKEIYFNRESGNWFVNRWFEHDVKYIRADLYDQNTEPEPDNEDKEN